MSSDDTVSKDECTCEMYTIHAYKGLEDNVVKVHNVYRWVWNEIATSTYGYTGSEIGFLADELEPKYIGTDVYGYKYLKEGTPVVTYLQEVRNRPK